MMRYMLALAALVAASHAVTLSTYLNSADLESFKSIFLQPYGNDLSELEAAVHGLTLLEAPLPDPQKICDTVKRNLKADDLKSLYESIYIATALKTSGKPCDVSFSGAETKLSAAITTDASTSHLYGAVVGLSLLGQKVDSAKVTAALEAALKSDDTPLSYAHAFYVASYLTSAADQKKFFDMIEDIVAQADEVDGKYLQFDGGLAPTATVVHTAYKLAGVVKTSPPITEDKIVKLTNYLLSRKHTHSRRDALFLLSALKELNNNKFHTFTTVSLASPVSVSVKSPVVKVRVCDLMGKPLSKLTITADSVKLTADSSVLATKAPFTVSTSDQTLFDLDLMKLNPPRGFYRILASVATSQPNTKLIAATGAEIEVKVTTQVSIDDVELSVADKDQSSTPKSNKLQYPGGKATIEVDQHQKLILKFSIKEHSTNKLVTAHQTFVRLTNVKTKQEVIFVAEQESTGTTYKFDLDVGAKSKDFRNLSGKYTMDLIVGDAVIENPISWHLADVQLTFQDDPLSAPFTETRYAKKPEITHLFREPEKRPPATVSNLFTGLVLAPILILFILWIKIGVNISNFPFSLSALAFHVGLAAIFGLYFCYFVKLNMFQTLRYLGLIGIPTFIFGHRLLSYIAAKSILRNLKILPPRLDKDL